MAIHRIAMAGLALLLGSTSAHAQTIVKSPAGPVRGADVGGQHVFKGIPYASAERWKAPVAVPAWQQVRAATRFGPVCQQAGYPAGSIYAETYVAMGEDCLSLNIWAPAKARNTPVFVWIHGGNLVRGSSSQPMFDGAELARRGVVVVSINYRLGIFGYFAHPELSAESPTHSSGNYGLMDQIAALQWVRRNIASFGGAPGKVTIAGESAGGLAILHLLASPLARGLFWKAIVQSASLMNIPDLKQTAFGLPSAEATGLRVAGGKSIADLRGIKPAALETMAQKALFASTAIVDGHALKRQLLKTFAIGEQARVPLLTGFNAGEIRTMRSILPGLPDLARFDAARYEATIRASYGALAGSFLKLYPDSDIEANIYAATRDGFFGWTSQRLVRDQAKIGQPAYLYYFDHGTPASDAGGIHAFHASEVPYMFGTIDRVSAIWPKIPDTQAERDLSHAMVAYWASFTRSGAPTAKGQPAWPVHNKHAAFMHFTSKPQVETDLKAGEYKLHDETFCRRRAAGNVPWNWNVGVISPPLPPAREKCR